MASEQVQQDEVREFLQEERSREADESLPECGKFSMDYDSKFMQYHQFHLQRRRRMAADEQEFFRRNEEDGFRAGEPGEF